MDKRVFRSKLADFFVRNFDVRQDKEDELETIDTISKGIEFKGTNLWVLIFATFIASLGLNTNSTAVIIGAMLISPLMGPIMGFGVGLGISDFDMIKRSFRNFATATIFSVIPSSIYFMISPSVRRKVNCWQEPNPQYTMSLSLFSEVWQASLPALPNPKEMLFRVLPLHCVDAASLYCRIRYSHREFVLFFWCFLSLLYQYRFYQCGNLSCGTRTEISQESFS